MMSVNKTYLPDRDSIEGKELMAIFPYADSGQLARWTQEFGYKNVDTFKDAMRRRLGVARPINVGWEEGGINIPLDLDTQREQRTFAVINDTQNPYHDQETVGLVERFLQDVEFHYLLYLGDMNDFYQLSVFDKNPKRVDDLQADVDSTKIMFHRHSKLFPDVKKYLIDGNHEHRWQKFLWTKAPALSSLTCLTVEELFRLKDFGITHIPYEQGLMMNKTFLAIHSDIASIHSGYTAKRLYEKHGGCGICGHTHRGGSFYKRDRFGTWGWWENFCLCHLNPDYIKNPNWVQGFSLVHFLGKRFWVEQIPIIDHTLMYGGKVYC